MKNNNRARLMAAAGVLAVGLILGGCGQKTQALKVLLPKLPL